MEREGNTNTNNSWGPWNTSKESGIWTAKTRDSTKNWNRLDHSTFRSASIILEKKEDLFSLEIPELVLVWKLTNSKITLIILHLRDDFENLSMKSEMG